MANAETVCVAVAYARAEVQTVIPLTLPAGSTVAQAIAQSGILNRFPEIDLAQQRVGIFARLVQLHDCVHAGDRIEIYRALIADPKETRRRRAAKSARGQTRKNKR